MKKPETVQGIEDNLKDLKSLYLHALEQQSVCESIKKEADKLKSDLQCLLQRQVEEHDKLYWIQENLRKLIGVNHLSPSEENKRTTGARRHEERMRLSRAKEEASGE